MNSTTRIWALACGVGAVAVLAGGWFIGVEPQLAEAATSAQAASAVDAQNQATQIKLAQLSKAAAKVDTLQAQNAVLEKSVPTILKPNTYIRRINELAALDGVRVGSVTLGDSAAYTVPESASGQEAATAGESAPVALAATDAAITPANFTSVPAAIVVTGTADAVLQFGHDIQNDERVFAIDGVQTTTDDTGTVSGTFNGYIYTLKR